MGLGLLRFSENTAYFDALVTAVRAFADAVADLGLVDAASLKIMVAIEGTQKRTLVHSGDG